MYSTRAPLLFVLSVASCTLLSLITPATPHAQMREGNSAVPAPRPETIDPDYTPNAMDFYYSNATIPRLNPLGLANRTRLGMRFNFFRDSTNLLLKGSHFSFGFAPEITPAFAQAGPFIHIKPLAILEIQAKYSWLGYYATFDHLQFFPSARSAFTPDIIRERGEQELNRATLQKQLSVSARLQGKVGPIALRSQFNAVHSSADARDGERTFYEPTFDTLNSTDGWLVFVDTDLLYVSQTGFSAGLRHNWLTPIFKDTDFAPGESTDIDLTQHRVGPLVAWTFDQNPGTSIEKQTVFAIVNLWLKHPNRAGQEVSRAFPYIAFGYAIQGLL